MDHKLAFGWSGAIHKSGWDRKKKSMFQLSKQKMKWYPANKARQATEQIKSIDLGKS